LQLASCLDEFIRRAQARIDRATRAARRDTCIALQTGLRAYVLTGFDTGTVFAPSHVMDTVVIANAYDDYRCGGSAGMIARILSQNVTNAAETRQK